MATRYGITMTRAPEAGVPLGRIETPRLAYAVIAVCTAAAAFLRFYQLTRPGYLLGVTEYDDGVQFGDAVRLVSGVVPYRDFVVMQPPGSIVLMAPVALLAKVTGSAWGLAIARLLTAAADTACVALLGLLVRHRGPVAAGIACGIYAVYPDALVAAHTLLLEPWMNLFCLIGALLVFDGDRLTDGRRLAWGGVAFGFAAAVKLWALVPLAVIGLLLLRTWSWWLNLNDLPEPVKIEEQFLVSNAGNNLHIAYTIDVPDLSLWDEPQPAVDIKLPAGHDWIVPGDLGLWTSSSVVHEILGIVGYAARGWYRF